MGAVGLIVCVVSLIAMIVSSIWAAVNLPSDTTFGARFGGTTGFDYRAGKKGSLITWPLTGLLVTGGAFVVSSETSDGGAISVLAAFTMLIMLGGQVSAIRRAR